MNDPGVPPSSTAAGPSGLTVSVCLGDPVVRAAVVVCAHLLGFTAMREDRQGRALVTRVGRTQPVALVLDLSMTGIDGLATITRAHDASPRTTIVMVMGAGASEHDLLAAGATYVVSDGDVAAVRAVLSRVASPERPPSGRAGTRRTKSPAS